MVAIKIALAQIASKIADKKANLEKILEFIEIAAGNKADIVVFPELALTGYVAKDLFYETAEPVPGPSTELIAEQARKYGIDVVFGMAEESIENPGILYNTSIFIYKDGRIEKYRKIYLPDYNMFEEGRYFRPGATPKVVKTRYGKIGLAICFDIFFPELIRYLALRGAHTIIVISASPDISKRFFETFTLSRALENTVNMVYVNTVGNYEGFGFWGGSHIVTSRGKVIAAAKYYEEDIVYGTIDLDDWRASRRSRPILKHFRTDIPRLLSAFPEP